MQNNLSLRVPETNIKAIITIFKQITNFKIVQLNLPADR